MKTSQNSGRLQEVSRSFVTATGHAVSYSLLAALLAAWFVYALLSGLVRGPFDGAKQRRLRQKPRRHIAILAIAWSAILSWSSTVRAQPEPSSKDASPVVENGSKTSNTNIWQKGVGEGFGAGLQSVGFDVGAGPGVRVLGSRENHDLVLPNPQTRKSAPPDTTRRLTVNINRDQVSATASDRQLSTMCFVGREPIADKAWFCRLPQNAQEAADSDAAKILLCSPARAFRYFTFLETGTPPA